MTSRANRTGTAHQPAPARRARVWSWSAWRSSRNRRSQRGAARARRERSTSQCQPGEIGVLAAGAQTESLVEAAQRREQLPRIEHVRGLVPGPQAAHAQGPREDALTLDALGLRFRASLDDGPRVASVGPEAG